MEKVTRDGVVYNALYLPIEEAVSLAAKQNHQRDVRLGITDTDEEWEEITEFEKKLYLSEARGLLEDTGENYYPEHDDHQLIILKK